jgi:serine/threonine-protein kinase
VHVYDHGVDSQSGRQYIAMEYLEGEDLEQRLRRVGRLSPKETMRICNEICRGLGRAHRMGIVHRDLKPANVFLSGDDEMVKLLDFGIAKVVGPRARDLTKATATGDVLGSPHYMSPEQARGQSVDGRSDLWSLAVIAYRLLTGKRPFDGDVPGDVIVRICTEPVVPPSQHLPSLNEGVDRFFERALAQDPDARFQSAEAFATELRAALVAAEPPRPASLEATHASASGASRRLALAGAAAAAVMALMGLQWGRYSTTSMPRLDSQASATLERVAADALRTSRGAVPSPTVVGGADPDGSPTAERPPDASSERAPPSAPLPKQARGVDMRDDVALGY